MHHPLCAGGGGDIPAISDLKVSPLNGTWWAIFLLALSVIAAIWLLRGRGRKSRAHNRRFLGWFGLVTLCCLLVYKTALAFSPDFDFHFWNELPLQPCNLIAILAILAAATDGKILENFCLCAGIPFAMVALLMPVEGFSEVPLLSINAIGFYGFHCMVLILSVSFGTLRVCIPRVRDIPATAALLAGLSLAVHGVNALLRAAVYSDANYFYTYGQEENVVLETLWRFIPIPLIYELPLVLVLVSTCLAASALSGLGPWLRARRGRRASHVHR